MSILLDRPDRPPIPVDQPDPDGPGGFVDCRGVWHTWDEEEN